MSLRLFSADSLNNLCGPLVPTMTNVFFRGLYCIMQKHSFNPISDKTMHEICDGSGFLDSGIS